MKIDDVTKVLGLGPGVKLCKRSWEFIEGCDSFEELWQTCKRGDDMLYVAEKLGVKHERLVRTACQCVRPVLPLAKSSVSRTAIETAERWCNGKATTGEVRRAADEALDAADAAYALDDARTAYDAATSATDYAAAHTAAAVSVAAYAHSAALNAADAVFYKFAFRNTSGSASAACDAMHWKCADIVRREIPWPIIEELIKRRVASCTPQT
jgi:hypothetical protein